MGQVLFAMFESTGQGDAALREVADRGFSPERCRITTHRDRISEGDLNLAESDAIRGLVFGLVGGFIGGAIVGAVVGVCADVFGLGVLAASVFGAFAFALVGGLAGALLGAGRVNRRLGRLAGELRAGKLLVTFEPDGSGVRSAIQGICQKHGGHELAWSVA
jgi:hypothetical protein